MEIALLRSCLSLPKLSFLLRSCPPAKTTDALNYFDNVMREGLSDLVGSPLSDWAWLKASLPSSSGGLGLRQATLHAPAAYIGSVLQAQLLVSDILGHSPSHPPYFNASLSSLRIAAAKPEWAEVDDINIPLNQHNLSRATDRSVGR